MDANKAEAVRIFDISLTLGPETPVYPGDPPFERQVLCAPGQGGPYELSSISLSAHAGTHIDAPKHFRAGGRSLDQISAGDFILPASVIKSDHWEVSERDLAHAAPQAGRAILFRTRNSIGGALKKPGQLSDSAHLSLGAARRCLELRAPLVGLDSLSLDRPGDDNYPIHHMLLGAGCFILEGIDLSEVPPGDYLLLCLPLKIQGGEASPVRAVLAAGDEIQRLSLTLGRHI